MLALLEEEEEEEEEEEDVVVVDFWRGPFNIDVGFCYPSLLFWAWSSDVLFANLFGAELLLISLLFFVLRRWM